MIFMNERFSDEPFDETKVADFVCDLAESQGLEPWQFLALVFCRGCEHYQHDVK
jgi:hypothetical protein